MKNHMKMTVPQKIMEILSAAFFIGMIVCLIFRWSSMPSEVPYHYDAAGNPDRWNPKSVVLMMPVIAIVLYAVLSLIIFSRHLWNVPENAMKNLYGRMFRNVREMLSALKLVLTGIFGYLTVCSALLRPWGEYFVVAAILLLLGTVVFYSIRIILSGFKKTASS